VTRRFVGDVREVVALAWPTVLTMVSYTLMQFVDAVMVAQVGPLEVAAQGNGGVWSFAPISFCFGVLSLVNTFVAQHVGAGRGHEAGRWAWTGLWLSGIAWIALLLPFGFLVMPAAFAAMGHEPALVELETRYAQILLAGGILSLGAKAVHNFLFGISRPKIVAVAAIAGNAVNLVCNYALIYGEAGLPALGLPGVPGAPALGVTGAAIATLCGVLVELLIPLALMFGPEIDRLHGTRRSWRPHWHSLRELLRVGWPAAIQFGNELICWAIFMSVLVGRFGTIEIAAGWAVLRYIHLSFMPAVGFSVATTTLVGRAIGHGEPGAAVRRTRAALAVTVAYMGLWALVMLLMRSDLVRLFAISSNSDAETVARIIEVGAQLMICAAVFQVFDAVGIIYTGALRGAGDTLWPGLVTIALAWGFIVGLGWWLSVSEPQWGALGPWIGASVYIVTLGIALAWRFERGRWRSIRLLEPAGNPAMMGDSP
jgi:MATE family multidrug resistance protein